jgi:hypothetical protein
VAARKCVRTTPAAKRSVRARTARTREGAATVVSVGKRQGDHGHHVVAEQARSDEKRVGAPVTGEGTQGQVVHPRGPNHRRVGGADEITERGCPGGTAAPSATCPWIRPERGSTSTTTDCPLPVSDPRWVARRRASSGTVLVGREESVVLAGGCGHGSAPRTAVVVRERGDGFRDTSHPEPKLDMDFQTRCRFARSGIATRLMLGTSSAPAGRLSPRRPPTSHPRAGAGSPAGRAGGAGRHAARGSASRRGVPPARRSRRPPRTTCRPTRRTAP